MYGSISRTRVKPGKREEYMEWSRSTMATSGKPPGMVQLVIVKSDADPDEVWSAIVSESKEAYEANSRSPEMQERWKQMSEWFDGPQEWHDGEVILPWS
ncbi:MAG: putative quinol monooxygenase [Candidatus Dormibacteria bacterium]